MFANFDYSNFPYVIVKLNETIKDDDDFNYLLIKKKKKKEHQYLRKSIIIVKSKIVRYLLELIFKLQSPVADVYLIDNKLQDTIEILKELKFNNLNIINKIKSGNSLIPFL